MGWRRVVEIGPFAVLLLAAGCGGSNARPDATGAGGIGVGGNGAAIVTREYTALLKPQQAVDLLFLIDDSSSMATAQASFRQSLGSFVDALRGGPNGLPDLHIAVISSDMGAGDGSISTCDATGGKMGIFQYTPRAPCTSTGLQAGATFISDSGTVKNYTGNLEDVLGCMTSLGEAGCGFEHQFAAITRALGVDGQGGPPAENQGFLRAEAYLVVVLLTNEDDCSVALGSGPNNRIPLFDTSANTNMASQLGPPQNFRCNEFGHMCSTSTGALMHPDRNAPNLDVAAMVTYDNCVSNDTEGFLVSAVDTANRLKGLKNDPSQVLVAAITGQASPYTVTWKTPSTADTSCNTTGKSCPWPVIAHACTASNGGFADPGVRTAALVNQFGANGLLLPICTTDFGPSLETLAAKLGTTMAGRCFNEPIADDPSRAGFQPQCTAVTHILDSQTGAFTDQVIPSCAGNGGAAPCWSVSTDASGCQRPGVTLAAAPLSSANVSYQCAVCVDGVAGQQGCPEPGRTGDRVGKVSGFGNPCDVGVSVASTTTGVNIISVGSGCVSGACLLPADQKGVVGTGALCTSSCNTTADCSGGLMGDKNDPNDHRCKTGFVCMVPTTVGDFCCQSMCVCRDFLYEPQGGFKTPAACAGAMAGTCGMR